MGSDGAGALPLPPGAGLDHEGRRSGGSKRVAGSRPCRDNEGDGSASQVATSRRSHPTGPPPSAARTSGRLGGGGVSPAGDLPPSSVGPINGSRAAIPTAEATPFSRIYRLRAPTGN